MLTFFGFCLLFSAESFCTYDMFVSWALQSKLWLLIGSAWNSCKMYFTVELTSKQLGFRKYFKVFLLQLLLSRKSKYFSTCCYSSLSSLLIVSELSGNNPSDSIINFDSSRLELVLFSVFGNSIANSAKFSFSVFVRFSNQFSIENYRKEAKQKQSIKHFIFYLKFLYE